MLVVFTGTLLGAMTSSTINLALPDLGREFGVTVDLAGWVVSSFLLSLAAVLLVAGRTADILGHRRVYLAGFALFGVASLTCGLSPGLWWLVASRVVQGVGSAMLLSAAPALLTTTYPPRQRGIALGMLMTATYVGLTIGPPLGGWIVDALGWRYIFFLMVPIAAAVVVLGAVFLPRPRPRPATFDWGGTVTLVAGMPLLLLALAEGHRWGWGSAVTLASAGTGAALLVTFVVIQARSDHPLIDPDLFRSRVFTLAVLAATGQYIAIFCYVILLPYYLVEALGLTTSAAGIVLSAQPLLMALVATPSGRLSDRVGTRWLSAAGLVVLTAAIGGLSTVDAATSPYTVAAWLAMVGLGTGVFISPNSSAIMGSAPGDRQGVAGGVIAVARSLGMMLGVTCSTVVFRLSGGETGGVWDGGDDHALHTALVVATVVGAVSALLAALGGDPPRSKSP
jgi:EmrB/QacA subfamily drug resistance transporter